MLHNRVTVQPLNIWKLTHSSLFSITCVAGNFRNEGREIKDARAWVKRTCITSNVAWRYSCDFQPSTRLIYPGRRRDCFLYRTDLACTGVLKITLLVEDCCQKFHKFLTLEILIRRIRVLLCFALLRIFKILPNDDSSRQKKKELRLVLSFQFLCHWAVWGC